MGINILRGFCFALLQVALRNISRLGSIRPETTPSACVWMSSALTEELNMFSVISGPTAKKLSPALVPYKKDFNST